MTETGRLPSIEVVIPALNEEKNLASCLQAVFRQEYPRGKLTVTVVDGGSTDGTVALARSFGCVVRHNAEVQAEAGVRTGIVNSAADLCCVLAVDNLIVNQTDFFYKIVKPFGERKVAGAFPWVTCSDSEPAINRYINSRAEPFSEFIYGEACNPGTFGKVYPVEYENEDYVIYRYDVEAFPLLALAQGFTVDRKDFIALAGGEPDDILPIVNLIRGGRPIAFVRSARMRHYQVMGLKAFINKFQWRIKNNLEKGTPRGTRLRRGFGSRKLLWALYAATILPPLARSLYRIVRTKQTFQIYHFITTVILVFLIPLTYLRFRFGKPRPTYR